LISHHMLFCVSCFEGQHLCEDDRGYAPDPRFEAATVRPTLFPHHSLTCVSSLLFSLSGHYTGHFKAVVYKPQNVLVMRDIMSSGYRAGGNTKFFITKNDGTRGDMNEIKMALMRRLNFEDGDGSLEDQPPSLLAFPMTSVQYQSGAFNTEMSVTSRLLPWEVNTRMHKSFPGGEQMFAIYDRNINLKAVHFGEDLRSTENMEYLSQVRPLYFIPTLDACILPTLQRDSAHHCLLFCCVQGSVNNSLCFVGPHRKWDSLTGSYANLVPGLGHWGPDARPGDVSFRRVLELVLLAYLVSFASPLTLDRSFLSAGPLAPWRGRLDDVGPRGHAHVRAAPVSDSTPFPPSARIPPCNSQSHRPYGAFVSASALTGTSPSRRRRELRAWENKEEEEARHETGLGGSTEVCERAQRARARREGGGTSRTAYTMGEWANG
jgi:hypothetical protein